MAYNNDDTGDAVVRQEFAQYDLAHEFEQIIDTEIDPCDDFYGYVCGKYPEKYPPYEKGTNGAVTSFTRIDREIEQRISTIVKHQYNSKKQPLYNFMHEIFESCMETDELNKQSLPYLKNLSNLIKKWPFKKMPAGFVWMKLNFLFRKWEGSFDTIAPIGFTIDPDDKSKYVLALTVDRQEIDRKNLKNGSNYIAYQQLVGRVMNSFSSKNDVKYANEIVSFEKQIYLIVSANNTKLLKTNISEISKQKLQMFEPYGFKNYVRFLLGNLNRTLISNLKIDESTAFVMQFGDYFKKMNQLLSQTPKRVIKNYMVWKFLEPKLPFLNERIRNALTDYSKVIIKNNRKQKRSNFCVNFTYRTVPHIINNLYIKKYSTKNSIATVNRMVNTIQNEIKEMTMNSSWIDSYLSNKTINFIDTMKIIVSHSESLLDLDLLSSEYDNFMLIWNKSELLKSIIEFNRIQYDELVNSYNEPIDESNNWKNFDLTFDRAYYLPEENSILIAIGIMQPPIFDNDLPDAFNYGSLGAIIGHELFHGFSRAIENIETSGKLKKYLKLIENYIKRRNSLQQHYSNFIDPVTKLHVNGERTLDENISDINGLVGAYRAFKRRNHTNDYFGNFEHTENQLFWLSFGRLWCANETPEHTKMRILTDNHAPKRFRVNGSLQNNPDFARDFNCPKDSQMNPKNKYLFY